jgi:hypothetical protein
VLEALRNFAQHRGFPVHDLHIQYRTYEREHGDVQILSAVPRLSIAFLQREGGFKTQVLSELSSSDKHAPLLPFIREYIAALGRIHAQVRQAFRNRRESWLGEVEVAQRLFTEMVRDPAARLERVVESEEDASGRVAELRSIDIFDDFLRRIDDLAHTHRTDLRVDTIVRASAHF